MSDTSTTANVMLQTSAELEQLAVALAKAQLEFGTIAKDKTATITSRKEGGRSYTFKYADLADVLKAVRPALAKNELALVQLVEGGTLVTALLHSSGQRLVSHTILVYASGDPKEAGAELTYRRRHAASAMLGVASDDDTDAQGLQEDDGPQPRSSEIRTPTRRSQPARPARQTNGHQEPPPQEPPPNGAQQEPEDTGELCTEGEQLWVKNRVGKNLDTLLKHVGATSLRSLTKAQFADAKSMIVRNGS